MNDRDLWMPTIEEETNAGVREISLYTRQFMERKIFLTGEIDRNLANRFLAQMMYLRQMGEEEIHIYINSSGGEVNAGLMIYDVLVGMDIPVNLYCTGMAASMAAVILAAGQKGRRFILPHSKTMIHEPLLPNGVGGSASSIKNISDSILETRNLISEILAKHTGKSVKEILKATSYDNYMNAEESIAFGICDAIKESVI